MAVINLMIGLVGLWALPGSADNFELASPLFFTLLLTLIVTLYDRYRPIHDAREALAGETQPTLPATDPLVAPETTSG